MPDWCTPCDACPRRDGYRAVGGDGPQPARVLAIMERPGQDESKYGRVACGNTGQEMDELYLPLAGLHRPDVRVCNTVLCGNPTNKAPTDKEIAQCAPTHIPREIGRTRPEVILLLGASACSLVPGVRLDYMHGIPQHTSKVGSLFGWSGWIVPMYHPAIGLHESRWMTQCLEDWEDLKDIIGTYYWAEDPPECTTDYALARGEQEVSDYFHNAEYIAMDTEQHAGRAWSMQVSVRPHTGILVRADDLEGVSALDFWLGSSLWDWETRMHHAAHDLEWACHMQVRVRSYRDTMQEAFALGNLPQGLKPLTYRLFRHTMTSFEETVRPASIRALQDWMIEALQVAQADFTHVAARYSEKTGKRLKDEVRKGELESLLRRLLQKADVRSDYDPWGTDKEPRLDAFWHDPVNDWQVAHVEARCGAYPVLGIANCTMQEAIRYAVGDADWTGQVATELARRRAGAFEIYHGDVDV